MVWGGVSGCGVGQLSTSSRADRHMGGGQHLTLICGSQQSHIDHPGVVESREGTPL